MPSGHAIRELTHARATGAGVGFLVSVQFARTHPLPPKRVVVVVSEQTQNKVRIIFNTPHAKSSQDCGHSG
jgi:hypothetical protein